MMVDSLILSRLYPSIGRSSPPEVFLGKGVLRICSRLIGEQPCRSTISIKLQSNFIEITIRHGCSPVNLPHIFRTPFPRNTSGWLLLYWLKVKSQYAHHFLQQDVLRIFRNRIHCIIHTETYKPRLMLEFGEQDLLGVPFRTERKTSYHER